jgi:hypothetical protein
MPSGPFGHGFNEFFDHTKRKAEKFLGHRFTQISRIPFKKHLTGSTGLHGSFSFLPSRKEGRNPDPASGGKQPTPSSQLPVSLEHHLSKQTSPLPSLEEGCMAFAFRPERQKNILMIM